MRRNGALGITELLVGGALGAIAAYLIFSPSAPTGPQQTSPDSPTPPPAPPPQPSNLPPAPPKPKAPGLDYASELDWLYSVVYRYTTAGWQLYQQIGPQQTLATADQQAQFVKSVPHPPFFYAHVYRWNGTSWQYVTGAGNY